ncbi:cytoplasmic protein [Dentipellis sp. KUC8613]|nr:cytoplasmic protein [Dentipellis sp. KUC8613]
MPDDQPLFPAQSRSDILAFQFSSWYPIFSDISPKSTVIRPLPPAFCEYLDAESVFVPSGSEDVPAESTIEDEDDKSKSDEEEPSQQYSFPELDAQIRQAVKEYGAVFPKLNFSSPKDAAWILPSSSPLKCTSPADVYLLLKSSDFVSHDLSTENVFADCTEPPGHDSDSGSVPKYELELVLRKWYPMDRSREMRCFVRDGVLIGISQRDTNHYDFLNEPQTRRKIASSIQSYWENNVKSKWTATASYTFDILLTRDLSRFHVLDFNPYALRTDSLLFTYEELQDISRSKDASDHVPVIRVIDSPSHPAAARNAPAHQHNMIPFEALSLSSGRGVEEFQAMWQEEVKKGMQDSDSDDE